MPRSSRLQSAMPTALVTAAAPTQQTLEPERHPEQPTVEVAQAPAATDEGPQNREKVLLKAPTLFQSSGQGEYKVTTLGKRKSAPSRSSLEWSAVSIVHSGESQTPFVQCRFCGNEFCATASRIKNHVLGIMGSAACKGNSDEFLRLKENLIGKAVESASKKQAKQQATLVTAAASSGASGKKSHSFQQATIESSIAVATNEACDNAIANLILGENLPFALLSSPLFKQLVHVLKSAPSSYKPPPRERMSGILLDSTCNRLRA